MNEMRVTEEAAHYCSLMSSYQVNVIVKAVGTNATAFLNDYATLRQRMSAPPAMLAMYGADRVDIEDVPKGMAALGFLLYFVSKQEWNAEEYRRVLRIMFGLTNDEAVKYAAKIDTDHPEGWGDKLKRLSLKVADKLTGSWFDADTAPADPDIRSEFLSLAEVCTDLTKRAAYMLSPFKGLLMKAMEGGDPGMYDVDKASLTEELEVINAGLKGDVIQPSELGGVFGRLKKIAGSAISAANAVSAIPGMKATMGLLPGGVGAQLAVQAARGLRSQPGKRKAVTRVPSGHPHVAHPTSTHSPGMIVSASRDDLRQMADSLRAMNQEQTAAHADLKRSVANGIASILANCAVANAPQPTIVTQDTPQEELPPAPTEEETPADEPAPGEGSDDQPLQ
jgi:hypothetical protein